MKILREDLRCWDFNEAADVSAKSHNFKDTYVELYPVTSKGTSWFTNKFGMGVVSVKVSKSYAIEMAHAAREDKLKFCL